MMRPETQIITLGVRDLEVSRRFYVDGLGWTPKLDVPGEVIFIQIGWGILLSLFAVDQLEEEAGGVAHGETAPPIAFGHLVESPDQVQQVIDRAASVGGTEVAHATKRDWGGVSGYFADPDGFRWEVAWNPGFQISTDGDVQIGPVT